MDREATVYVVDDDEAGRDSLRCLLESAGWSVQTFPSAETFLDAWQPSLPGCLVLDLNLPGMGGLELQQRLREDGASIPVIVVSAYGDVRRVVQAMQAGAIEFHEKPVAAEALLASVERAVQLDAELQHRRQELAEIAALVATLSRREREVLALMVAGKPTKIIAAELGVSPNTVENQRASILRKMRADSVVDVVRMVTFAHAHAHGDAPAPHAWPVVCR